MTIIVMIVISRCDFCCFRESSLTWEANKNPIGRSYVTLFHFNQYTSEIPLYNHPFYGRNLRKKIETRALQTEFTERHCNNNNSPPQDQTK